MRMKKGGNSSIDCYPDGTYEYKKRLFVPSEYRDKRVTIEFEGVYNYAAVYINGDFAYQHPYGREIFSQLIRERYYSRRLIKWTS